MAKFQRTSEHAQSAIIQRNTWKHLEFVNELVVKSPNILFTFEDTQYGGLSLRVTESLYIKISRSDGPQKGLADVDLTHLKSN